MRVLLFAALVALSLCAADRVRAAWPSDGLLIAGAPVDETNPIAVPDGAGGAFVLWRGDSPRVWAQHVSATGFPLWSTPLRVCAVEGSQFAFDAVVDGAGGFVTSWSDLRIASDYDVYAQRVDGSGALLWDPDGVLVAGGTDHQRQPRLAVDGQGGCFVAWKSHPGASGPPYDLYMQRLDASGASLWTAGGVAVCVAAGDQDEITIARSGAGGAIVAWSDQRDAGMQDDIYAQRFSAAGSPVWTANGVGVCTKTGPQVLPQAIPDGANGAVLVWEDRNPGYSDVFMQHLDSGGNALGYPNGQTVCNATGDQGDPSIVSDGLGSAIVAWSDRRAGPGVTAGIYAQRISMGLAVFWPANGVEVLASAGDIPISTTPMMVSDGQRGAIIVWRDHRLGPTWDLFAQRIDLMGVKQWDADGVPVCTAEADQFLPVVAFDGAEGAIVAWYDYRNGTSYDVYANHVGMVPTAVGGAVPPARGVLRASPNPFGERTTIEFNLRSSANVSVELFDVGGRRVVSRALGALAPGPRRVTVDARDAGGHELPSGVYFCRVSTAGRVFAEGKLVIAR